MFPLPPVEVGLSLVLLLAESASLQLLSPQGERKVPSLPLGRPGTGPSETPLHHKFPSGGGGSQTSGSSFGKERLIRRFTWKVVVQSDQHEDQERQKWGSPALGL